MAAPPLAAESAIPGTESRSTRAPWRERWLRLRNKLLGDPGFQRWAADFPLTRPIARRRARALFDLVAGFVYAQVLSAAIELDLFALLADGPLSIPVLAPRLKLSEDAAERFLKAAASLELAERLPDGRYALGHLGAAMRGNPSVAAMVEHHSMLYADLADPVALLRGEIDETELGRYWAYARNADPASVDAEAVRGYSHLMAQSQALVAGEILDAYDLRRHRRLLDIGGGEGVFLAAAAARAPALELMLFDLPAVAERAALRFANSGLASRARVFEGSFFHDALPKGADVASLVRILHDHDDAGAAAILAKVRAALPAGGTLLIAEPMSGTPGARPVGDAYFGFYLAAMGSGRPRRPDELAALLGDAGFARSRLVPTRTPMLVRLMVAAA